jgi:PIN like domain
VSRVKPAEVRFYLDADILGVAKILSVLRPDVTYPGDPGGVVHKRERPPCPITTPKINDEVWIPEVTAHGWLIITRDSKIQLRRREINAVREHSARMVALSGTEAYSTFDQLEILMCQWRAIVRCLDQKGPFIYSANRTGRLRPVDLSELKPA